MILNVSIFLIACTILIFSGSFAVKSLTKLATAIGISYFAAGFLLMAFATTFPELLVGITSALEKAPSLSLGNVLGSNIANLGLILGIAALVKGLSKKSPQRGIEIESKIIKDDILYLVPLVLLPLILLLDGSLSRFDGWILIGAFILYFIKLIKEKREFKTFLEEKPIFAGCFLNFWIFIFSVAGLILSAKFVVDYGILIASFLQIPVILIGLSAVALGTSLPELVFALKTVSLNKDEMMLGDLVGACAINSSLIIGITAIIAPIFNLDFFPFAKASIFLAIILLFFVLDIRSKNGIRWPTGLFLIFLYIAFLTSELLF